MSELQVPSLNPHVQLDVLQIGRRGPFVRRVDASLLLEFGAWIRTNTLEKKENVHPLTFDGKFGLVTMLPHISDHAALLWTPTK